ncbi:MAG TPA: thiamine pyrophosphate-dependent enzyme [Clostridia bacterium]|nr:thiamine pyrophosphate-dependent enzyme [Clostridia bacterium]
MDNNTLLLLGDEAVAQGALDAGVSGFYAYPGTPSTEIMEYVQRSTQAAEKNIHRTWSANEKTAVEAALGMSYTGKRTMAMMKHVGLNVAADPFINSGITGANGGIIVTVADDPSMHSSQDEQDSRVLANFAMVPVLEPSNQQEAYQMCFTAFELSEKFQTPVMLRLTTRIAHSRSGVKRGAPLDENQLAMPEDKRQFVLLPAIARGRYKLLLEKQPSLEDESNNSPYNRYYEGSDTRMGIIAGGIAYNYVMENFQDQPCPYPLLKLSQYPIPRKYIERMVNECDEVLVIEEGMPVVEEKLRGLLDRGPSVVKGRMTGELPRDGELNPRLVRKALGLEANPSTVAPEVIAPRPPALCPGCSHIDAYHAINEAIKAEYGDGHVFADIGCYTLGALPPFEAINSCVDMGASITMAKGAADAGLYPSAAVIGDSTFTHSGMTGLLDAVIENSNIVVFILDNSTTAMTGGQNSHANGRLHQICEGLGVDPEHIRSIMPKRNTHDQFVQIIKEELAYKGVSVIIPQRECVQTQLRRAKQKQQGGKQ